MRYVYAFIDWWYKPAPVWAKVLRVILQSVIGFILGHLIFRRHGWLWPFK